MQLSTKYGPTAWIHPQIAKNKSEMMPYVNPQLSAQSSPVPQSWRQAIDRRVIFTPMQYAVRPATTLRPDFFALPDALANVERPFRVEHYLTVKSFDHDRVQMTYSPSCSTKSLTCNNNRQSGLRSNCKKTNSSVVNKQNKTNSGEVNKRKETHTSDAYKRITDWTILTNRKHTSCLLA